MDEEGILIKLKLKRFLYLFTILKHKHKGDIEMYAFRSWILRNVSYPAPFLIYTASSYDNYL